jgi:hypothetical protein
MCHMLQESNYANNVGETEIVIPAHPGRTQVGPLANSKLLVEANDCHVKESK